MAGCLTEPTIDQLIDEHLSCQNKSISEKDLLSMILAKIARTQSSLVTEKYDKIEIEYVGLTNNIDTVTYSLEGAPVAVLTMAYSGGVPVTDDALLISVTKG